MDNDSGESGHGACNHPTRMENVAGTWAIGRWRPIQVRLDEVAFM